MAEVQTSTEAGETARRFVEFVLMQAQHAALCLGQFPHPETGRGEVNLEMARILIDQLAMIRAKTRGNLSPDEMAVLNNAISSLQMAYVEVAGGAAVTAGAGMMEGAGDGGGAGDGTGDVPAAEQGAGDRVGGEAGGGPAAAAPADDAAGRKRYSKNYG